MRSAHKSGCKLLQERKKSLLGERKTPSLGYSHSKHSHSKQSRSPSPLAKKTSTKKSTKKKLTAQERAEQEWREILPMRDLDLHTMLLHFSTQMAVN